uniref:Ovule protein n=1 Tax=Meloidogyne incognita TaxID=6306 RepID=A0A914M950_MELIC
MDPFYTNYLTIVPALIIDLLHLNHFQYQTNSLTTFSRSASDTVFEKFKTKIGSSSVKVIFESQKASFSSTCNLSMIVA